MSELPEPHSPVPPSSGKEDSLLARLIELERIDKEGATLKVVSENMRSLLTCVAMFIGVGALYKTGDRHWIGFVLAIGWGVWSFAFPRFRTALGSEALATL